MTTCIVRRCEKPAGRREMCRTHYRKAIKHGIYGYRPVGALVEHIQKLRDLGWTYEQMRDASGVSQSTFRDIFVGEHRWVSAPTYRAVLSVPLEPRVSRRGTAMTGAVRRLQALMWMGWRLDDLCPMVGLTRGGLRACMHRGAVSFAAAARIREVYERISHLDGGSIYAKGKARQLGYAPPAAWDDDTIDDPNAVPQVDVEGDTVDEVAVQRVLAGKASGEILTRSERIEAARRMAAAGVGVNAIGRRLGCSYHVVTKLLEAS
jgi:hypothetical protein